nr:MAG TPA: winged helix-turn-helix DNA-binding protein [Caudoviricetes sp.]
MTKPHQWDRHSILGELRRRGMTLTRLAEIDKVSPGGFRTIWTRPNERAERTIAKFLGLPVEELFPDRYPKRTARILSPRYDPDTSTRKPQRSAA